MSASPAATPRSSGAMAYPRAKMHSHGGGDGVEARLQSEVDFLTKKIKYLQSVSTIFRQKIALIMRECSKNPNSFPEYHRMYAKVVGEITKAEEAVAGGDLSGAATAIDGTELVQFTGASGHHASVGRSGTDVQAKRDSIDKAHQLCRILAEKNELKQKEVEMRRKYDELVEKYEDVNERHTRLIELQSSGGGIAKAQLEAFKAREAALEKALIEAKSEAARAAVGGNNDTSLGTASLADGVAFASDSTHAKQNQLLKARVEKLKQELAKQTEDAQEGSKRLQLSVETLAAQLHSTRRELEGRDLVVRRARKERDDMAQELTRERGLTQLLQSKVDAMEAEITHTHRRGGGGGDASALSEAGRGTVVSSTAAGGGAPGADVEAAVEVYRGKLEAAEGRAHALQDKLWKMETEAHQKDVEIQGLGAQLKALRGRVEAFEGEIDQRQTQRAMVEDVERRMLDAVRAIQQSQTTTALSDQMTGISGQLQRLEGLELQLRQKEDLLALSEDELSQLRQTHAELLDALSAVSSLFMELPKSVASLERLVIEHAEYRAELHAKADAREPPDVVGVNSRIELRCIEAEAARKAGRGQVHELAAQFAGTPTRDEDDAYASQGHHQTSLQRPGDFGVGDTSAVPPPPPLVNLSSALNDSRPARREMHADPGVRCDSASAGAVSEDDARITFQLFDERGTGALPADVVRLCLTTLGLPATLVPPGMTSMTAAEFLALCSNRSRDHDL